MQRFFQCHITRQDGDIGIGGDDVGEKKESFLLEISPRDRGAELSLTQSYLAGI